MRTPWWPADSSARPSSWWSPSHRRQHGNRRPPRSRPIPRSGLGQCRMHLVQREGHAAVGIDHEGNGEFCGGTALRLGNSAVFSKRTAVCPVQRAMPRSTPRTRRSARIVRTTPAPAAVSRCGRAEGTSSPGITRGYPSRREQLGRPHHLQAADCARIVQIDALSAGQGIEA